MPSSTRLRFLNLRTNSSELIPPCRGSICFPQSKAEESAFSRNSPNRKRKPSPSRPVRPGPRVPRVAVPGAVGAKQCRNSFAQSPRAGGTPRGPAGPEQALRRHLPLTWIGAVSPGRAAAPLSVRRVRCCRSSPAMARPVAPGLVGAGARCSACQWSNTAGALRLRPVPPRARLSKVAGS